MNIFSHHKLIKVGNEYTLILYFDNHSIEFARDFIGSISDKTEELSKAAADSIKFYIEKNVHNVKIKTVKIMLGSLLIASIPVAAIYTLSIDSPKDMPTGDTSNPKNTVNDPKAPTQDNSNVVTPKQPTRPSQTPTSRSSVTSDESKPTTVEPINNLILVNKSHSVSSSYVPKGLIYPNVAASNKSKTMMTKDAAATLEALFEKAKQDNIKLYAISGYRSYSLQKQIFQSNTIRYGSANAANQYSARPGESEHQTGLAMDVSCESLNFTLEESFAQTPEGKWLKENAPQFGFIIRYPKGKENITGYQFEPWHIRYVGKDVALEISSRDITLEEYLGK